MIGKCGDHFNVPANQLQQLGVALQTSVCGRFVAVKTIFKVVNKKKLLEILLRAAGMGKGFVKLLCTLTASHFIFAPFACQMQPTTQQQQQQQIIK